jgi:UDP-glucose 4-epimerase
MADGTSYLITGGAGFIGSHLADILAARRESVVVLDNITTGRVSNIQHLIEAEALILHAGSVLDADLVRKLVRETDVVVHLAASVGVNLIIAHPLESLTNNIRGTEVVLEACADLDRKVLVASTSEIYGKNGYGQLREDSDRILGSPFKARWSYSTAKAVDEILAYGYWRERGTPSIVARLFNCVGPRQTGDYGMVLPSFVQQALAGDDVTVFGEGTQSRCFCHVKDTVGAIVALLDHEEAIGDVFNVGGEREVTMNDLARLVIDMTSSTSKIVHIPYDDAYEEGFEDMDRRVPDITKIRSMIGWEPAFTLEETIADVIAHERQYQGVASAPGKSGL